MRRSNHPAAGKAGIGFGLHSDITGPACQAGTVSCSTAQRKVKL
jgi:hypothetical protein